MHCFCETLALSLSPRPSDASCNMKSRCCSRMMRLTKAGAASMLAAGGATSCQSLACALVDTMLQNLLTRSCKSCRFWEERTPTMPRTAHGWRRGASVVSLFRPPLDLAHAGITS